METIEVSDKHCFKNGKDLQVGDTVVLDCSTVVKLLSKSERQSPDSAYFFFSVEQCRFSQYYNGEVRQVRQFSEKSFSRKEWYLVISA